MLCSYLVGCRVGNGTHYLRSLSIIISEMGSPLAHGSVVGRALEGVVGANPKEAPEIFVFLWS